MVCFRDNQKTYALQNSRKQSSNVEFLKFGKFVAIRNFYIKIFNRTDIHILQKSWFFKRIFRFTEHKKHIFEMSKFEKIIIFTKFSLEIPWIVIDREIFQNSTPEDNSICVLKHSKLKNPQKMKCEFRFPQKFLHSKSP